MAWLPDVPVGEVGSSSTFFPVPNISNVVGGGFVEGKDENNAFYDVTLHFMMLQSKDYRDPSILTLGRNNVKVKITRIHPSLDPSSQSTTKAQTRAPPDINDAAIRIIFFINIVTKKHIVDLPWALVQLH